MGCNGNGHSVNCTCGFGISGKPSAELTSAEHKEANKNLTFPLNCHICGLPIFIYRNTYGRPIAFEKLGHPWPKHNCRKKTKREKTPDLFSSQIQGTSDGEPLYPVPDKNHENKVCFEYG